MALDNLKFKVTLALRDAEKRVQAT